ncbi:MAG: DNA mismatch repair protein MutS [Deltaproteobacteria bacterium]|nr:DNA mismatch repair protein MutS [Deltaproteobacteria bacterium]MBW2413027.1 DNA mismatch repair protein MutS [Deltaproteobacteria bacterium]
MPSKGVDTPMMQQYLRLKAQVPEALLLFRMGDFYELFLEDAETAAPLLDLVLTTRDKGVPNPVPMCGLPYHAAEGYIRRLLEAGRAVAIAEQVEDPKLAKGLVRREIVEVVSPGLVANGDRLPGSASNYIAAVLSDESGFGLAYLDISTGEFAATETAERAVLEAELDRVSPRELVLRDAEKGLADALPRRQAPDADFDPAAAERRVGRLPQGLEPAQRDPASRAAAALWVAVATLQPQALEQLRRLRRYVALDRMVLDRSTRRHLELVANLQDGGTRGTLLELLDRTRTPMGRRRLVRWIGEPLVDVEEIAARQDRLQEWIEPDSRRRALAEALRSVGDLERILTRVCLPASGPRDFAGLRASLSGVVAVHEVAPLADPLDELRSALEGALVDDPPPVPRGEPHTGYVRDGVDAELDRVRADGEEGNAFLASLEARERERLGIPTLRLRYNRVFGHSIEVTRPHLARVPDEYVRKQTTANAERFTTEELQRWEGVVLRGRESAAAVEARVLGELRRSVADASESVRVTAEEIAELDTLQSLAEVARTQDFARPEIDASLSLDIDAGRHPVVERYVEEGFVPNDVHLDGDDAGFVILTGPNMAGKSTLLRQVALIALLAQMGSWVPARQARVGVVDRIFTRVGASDSLVTGESTFMVEMRETAVILAEATHRSLVLLDEIGRGTSTFDGLSIAWAVVEYLHDTPGLRPRTFFATHYHELADLAQTRAGVRNFHFTCAPSTSVGGDGSGGAEGASEILFLRRMEPGAASRSYGIEVARHAGLPPEVIRRARAVLANLEGGEFDERGEPRLARESSGDAPQQLALFEPARDPLREALRRLVPDQMTPIEAIAALDHLCRLARGDAPSGGDDPGEDA